MVSLKFNTNFKDFRKQINNVFSRYTWKKPKQMNECSNVSIVTLSNTQKFVSSYFTPKNPNGILLYHSVGAGKTLTAVNVLSKFEAQGFHTLWVTRTTLRKDLYKALDMIPLKKNPIVLSYKQFSNVCKRRGEIYHKLRNRTKDDFLSNTVIIIDEAHKLYTKDLKPQELHDIQVIQKEIHKSYTNPDTRCRLVLMTATPITEDPMEFIKLLNLIITREPDRFDILKFKDYYLTSDGKFKSNKIQEFKEHIKDLISYIDLSKDVSKFAKVNMTEILVPISSPNFDITQNNKDCIKKSKLCNALGVNKVVCDTTKNKCLELVKENKKQYSNTDYQSKILATKCYYNS